MLETQKKKYCREVFEVVGFVKRMLETQGYCRGRPRRERKERRGGEESRQKVCNVCRQKYAHRRGGGHTLTASLVLRPSSTSSFFSSCASPSSSRQVVLDVRVVMAKEDYYADPHGGKLTETFEVDKTGNKMTQTSKILVNEDATTGTCHTPVFLRVSKGGKVPVPLPPLLLPSSSSSSSSSFSSSSMPAGRPPP